VLARLLLRMPESSIQQYSLISPDRIILPRGFCSFNQNLRIAYSRHRPLAMVTSTRNPAHLSCDRLLGCQKRDSSLSSVKFITYGPQRKRTAAEEDSANSRHVHFLALENESLAPTMNISCRRNHSCFALNLQIRLQGRPLCP
jgi:hypothetical protein